MAPSGSPCRAGKFFLCRTAGRRLTTPSVCVRTAAKPPATNILSSHLDDPILSAWRAGLGRAAVFTADLGSPWSASLRGWQDFARLWTQSVRWISRRSDDPALVVAITEED